MYNAGEIVTHTGDMSDSIFFVARGIMIEKNGDLEDFNAPQIKFSKGQIASLQNLIPGSETKTQISNVFCSNSIMGSVYKLNLKHLKFILIRDQAKMQKLWEMLAWRLIIIHNQDLKAFSTLTQEKVKLFCKMCQIKKYNPGDLIDLGTGGILFKGSLSKV